MCWPVCHCGGWLPLGSSHCVGSQQLREAAFERSGLQMRGFADGKRVSVLLGSLWRTTSATKWAPIRHKRQSIFCLAIGDLTSSWG